MITKLSPEQEALIPVVRDRWVNKLTALEFNEEQAREGIKWLYEFSGLKEPKIFFCESPLQIQQICNILAAKGSYNGPEDLAEIKGKKLEYYDLAFSGTVRDYGWCAYIDFFREIGIAHSESFTKFTDLLNSGIFEMVQLESFCVASKLPVKIVRNEKGEVEADGEPAILFRDGFCVYMQKGTRLPEKYGKVKTKDWDPDWIVEESNDELRALLLDGIGLEKATKHLQLAKIDSWKEYELYESPLFEHVRFLKMTCPSSKTEHFEAVPRFGEEAEGELNTCQKANAWANWYIKKEDLRIET